jgi:hypothetical protein
VLFDRLPASEREVVAAQNASVGGFYGVLRPLDDWLAVKSVDRETALLFLTLAEPGPLPQYVGYERDASARREIHRLVADGVLQVDLGAGFVSGPDAVEFYSMKVDVSDQGRIAALSRDALRYAQVLSHGEYEPLVNRIYGYNRLPLTPHWRRLLSSREHHAEYLGIARSGPAARALSRDWPATATSKRWLSWGGRLRRKMTARSVEFKLYVSPTPDALGGEGFASVVSALSSSRATHFKIGAGAADLLRPDKLIAYFPDFETLAEGASRLRERLAGMPAQGVPFTAELGSGALLSWGIDPPRAPGGAWGNGESWRLWIARRLASAIMVAHETSAPSRFALQRLQLEGVDTETWTPELSIFSES